MYDPNQTPRPDQMPPQGQPPMNAAPPKTTQFDVEKNPEDMQFMTDALMYVPMLKAMNPRQRKEKWPGIAQKLAQVSPKAQGLLDPTLAPSDEELDQLMGQMPQVAPEKIAAETGADLTDASQVPGEVNTSEMDEADFIAYGMQKAFQGGQQAGFQLEPSAPKAPSGYRWTDETYRELEPIPKGPADKSAEQKKLPAESGGKIAMIQVASAFYPTIKQFAFNEDGSLNRENVFKSNLPFIGGAIPFHNEARRLANAYEYNIQAITRVETGAAMPQSELTNTRERYQINVWDSEDSALQKTLALKLFLNGYLDLTYLEDTGKKDANGKPIKVAHYDTAKAKLYEAKMQIELLNYKKDWMKKMVKANPGVPIDAISQEFNKKILNGDQKLLSTLGAAINPYKDRTLYQKAGLN